MAAGSALAWTKKTVGFFGDLVAKTIVTHSSTATITYTPVMDFVAMGKVPVRKIAIAIEATVISGTNIDVALYGSDTPTGTKYLLLDAPVADLTNGVEAVGIVDLHAYPAPYYWLGFTTDGDESAVSHRSIVRVFIPSQQP